MLELDTILSASYLREGVLKLYHLPYHQVKCGMMEDVDASRRHGYSEVNDQYD